MITKNIKIFRNVNYLKVFLILSALRYIPPCSAIPRNLPCISPVFIQVCITETFPDGILICSSQRVNKGRIILLDHSRREKNLQTNSGHHLPGEIQRSQ